MPLCHIQDNRVFNAEVPSLKTRGYSGKNLHFRADFCRGCALISRPEIRCGCAIPIQMNGGGNPAVIGVELDVEIDVFNL